MPRFFGLVMLVFVTACSARTRGAELYPDVARQSNKKVSDVRFVGADPFKSDTLLSLIDTQPSHCTTFGFPICLPVLRDNAIQRLSVDVVRRDVARLAAFYRREGYFGTRVLPRAEPTDSTPDGEVQVTFIIERGDPIQLDSLTLEGLGALADSLRGDLPLKAGDLFSVARYEASADYITRELQARGFARAEVLRNYTVDTIANRAVASLSAEPGPQVRVDSVIVRGAEHLGRAYAVRQLTFSKGDLLKLPALVESQRNLYSLEIVQLASVSIAPDSLQLTPNDNTTATVLVSISEAPANQAEAAFGYGNVDCFRGEASYLNRSFGGGARRLNLQTSISKVGLGGFQALGFNKWLCTAYKQDEFQNSLDYHVSTEFTQPYFLSPRNQLSFGLYSERVSEPSVYQRTAHGGQLSLSHRLKTRRVVNVAVDLSRVKTLATPVLFCSAFQICVAEQIDRLTIPRYRNTISSNYIDDHTDAPLDPTRGHAMRMSLTWATPWFGSSVRFLRWTGDGSIYRGLGRGRVLAMSARFGNYFQTASISPDADVNNFLPPEDRFFAGGSTTVRGYGRNELGRGVYVTNGGADTTFVPTGGNSLGIVNTELRMPSPFFSRQLRLVAFVDAGAVATGNLWTMDAPDWRFTPGVGARATTPVGPLRLDIAFNPYRLPPGTLFQEEGDRLVPVSNTYQPPGGSFIGKLQFQIGIGQAF